MIARADTREMISLDDARAFVLASSVARPSETIALEDARGRYLAQTLHASEDLVPFARSAMDGFAVLSSDTARGATLPVGERVFAEAGDVVHRSGTATPISTGAPLPRGADAVIPIEDTSVESAGVRLSGAVAPGDHVFPPGEDALRGDVLARAGTRLTAALLGLLAAAGHARVPVHKRPTVAILCTGDELVAIDRVPRHGEIRNSNAIALAGALAEAGADIVRVVHVRDRAGELRAALAGAIGTCDMLVTTGGASVGERDLMKAELAALGVRFGFHSVALRPAKPTAFGRMGCTLVAVLPGNPSSAFVALHVLVIPAVAKLAGSARPLPARVEARLVGELRGKNQRTFAAFARLAFDGASLTATPLANQCSALTRTAADAAGLILIPPGRRIYGPGDLAAVDVLDWAKIGESL